VAFRPWIRQEAQARFPKKLYGKCDPSDVVQDVQGEVAATIGSFRGSGTGQFHAWIAIILRSRILKLVRFWGRERRDIGRELSLNFSHDHVETVGSRSMRNSPSAAMSLEDGRQHLALAMSFCRKEDRELISLHLFEDKRHEEIAVVQGIEVAAARKRYSRAIQRLREAVNLVELLAGKGIDGPRLEAIVLHRLQGLDPTQIAKQLQLPESLVVHWLADAPRRREE
jgi:RNA polymerase sigma-70 factor (ECF subfamily)